MSSFRFVADILSPKRRSWCAPARTLASLPQYYSSTRLQEDSLQDVRDVCPLVRPCRRGMRHSPFLSTAFAMSLSDTIAYSTRYNNSSKTLSSPSTASYSSLAPHERKESITRLSDNRTWIGLFSDMHFQDRNLDRLEETGQWLIEMFQKRRVGAVVCLGDVLNTRDVVSVVAQCAALSFIDRLGSTLQVC